MHPKIQKWGNSQGVRLSKKLLSDAQLGIGDEVDISVKEGSLIVAPAKRVRGRHKLEDLVARIPKNYQAAEVDWGKMPASIDTDRQTSKFSRTKGRAAD